MTAQVDRIARELERLGERIVRAIVFEVTAELVASTPVDTGWARANWIPSIGAPNTSTRTNRPTPGIVPSAAAEQAAGLAIMSTFELGQTAFITNNVPYISKLNGGSSTQAPANFVDRAVQSGVIQAARKFAT
ncbi:MAG: HK97 gp10 family phage protein [Cyanobacteria bacterium J06638_20]